MTAASLLASFNALPPRSRELALYAVRRPELPLTDIAELIQMADSNMRGRMLKVYEALGILNRGELIAVFGPLLPDDVE